MSRKTVRTAIAAAAMVVLTSLSGCAAGFDAQTNKPYAPANGSIANLGSLRIRSVVVLDNGSGQAEVVAVLVNNGTSPDALTGIGVSGADKMTVPGSALNLPPQVGVPLGPDTPNRVFIEKFTKKPGDLVTVQFTFREAGVVNVSALVMTPESFVAGG